GASLKVDPTIAWESSEESLKVEATLSLPNFAATTGRRLLLPVSLFQQHGAGNFSHPTRTYPIFFPYAFQEIDAVRIRVPDTFQIESVPPPVESNLGFGAYRLSVSGNAHEIVTIDRRFVLEKCFFPQDSYASIRSLFAQVRRK